MKFLTLVLVLISTSVASAGNSKEAALKKSVGEKLRLCIGVQGLDGYVIFFNTDNTATVGTLTAQSNKVISQYAASQMNDGYGYKGIYEKYLVAGDVKTYFDTTWSVKGSSVYVKLDGKNNSSISIGMKSRFCSVN